MRDPREEAIVHYVIAGHGGFLFPNFSLRPGTAILRVGVGTIP
jgi:hypothetical protein